VAALLIRQWGLAELRVRLDLAGTTPTVVAQLWMQGDDDERSLRWQGSFGLAEFGLVGSGPPVTLRVPDRLPADVQAAIQTHRGDETAIWLRLVPYCGHLSAVPWEEAMLAVGGLPVLRVPDRLPVAVDPGRVWTAAIVVSAPADSDWEAWYVNRLLMELPINVPTDLAVHVFADAGTAQRLQRVGVPGWASVHVPGDARSVSAARTRRGVSQFGPRWADPEGGPTPAQVWADWIAEGLGGLAARAVHLVLNAAWDGDRPRFAVSPDPAVAVRAEDAVLLTGEEVRTLADVLGAATLSFGSPPDNPADAATRVIADQIGRERPGATLYSALGADPSGAALAAAWGFVAAPERRRFVADPSLFAYLQPELLARSQVDGDPARSVVPNAEPVPVLEQFERARTSSTYGADRYAGAETVSSWAAGADRYVETQLGKLIQSSDAPADEIAQAYSRGATEALAEIQDMVDRYRGSS
jgi:hypothetical protein